MTIKALKVDTTTLALIDQFIKSDPEAHKKLSDMLASSIKLYTEAQGAKHLMLKEDTQQKLVRAKKTTKKLVIQKHGKKGPYTVKKTVQSMTGRDSYYLLDGSDSVFPTDWFDEVQPVEPTPSRVGIIVQIFGVLLWSALLFLSGYSLGMIQYIFLLSML